MCFKGALIYYTGKTSITPRTRIVAMFKIPNQKNIVINHIGIKIDLKSVWGVKTANEIT